MSVFLYRDNDPWRQLLEQEGLPVRSDWQECERAPVVVLSAEPDKADSLALRRLVGDGGAVIGSARDVSAVWPEVRCRSARLDYIVPDGSTLFRNVGIIDIGLTALRAEAASIGSDQSGKPVIASIAMGAGHVLVLPFELTRLASDTRAVQRQFYVRSRRMAHERVSRVGRGDVRRLVANCFRQMLWRRNKPYVHLAYQPGGGKVSLGVRIDTDESPVSALRATAGLADRAGLKFSWFVNTGSATADLAYMRELHGLGHDIQLHCRAHRVYSDYGRSLRNVKAGIEDMGSAGLRPCGFAAPYGDWNEALARALADSDISYSSEFGHSYDDLPSFPTVAGRRSSVLQIPVHPVCLGLLRAAGATAEAIVRHYRDYAELQVARREPCLLYDHPDSIERHADVYRAVLESAAPAARAATTMTAFAAWWRQRLAAKWQAHHDDETEGLTIEVESADGDLAVSVEQPGCSASMPLRSDRLRYDALLFKPSVTLTRSSGGEIAARELSLRARIRFAARTVRKSLQEWRERL